MGDAELTQKATSFDRTPPALRPISRVHPATLKERAGKCSALPQPLHRVAAE
jgi:hypothetical protein